MDAFTGAEALFVVIVALAMAGVVLITTGVGYLVFKSFMFLFGG